MRAHWPILEASPPEQHFKARSLEAEFDPGRGVLVYRDSFCGSKRVTVVRPTEKLSEEVRKLEQCHHRDGGTNRGEQHLSGGLDVSQEVQMLPSNTRKSWQQRPSWRFDVRPASFKSD